MKYITILEKNADCASPNIGTITTVNLEEAFKVAVQSHFDANVKSYSFDKDDVNSIDDCINAYPIDVTVVLDVGRGLFEAKVELSQTWLY
jgi:hypothetical protein